MHSINSLEGQFNRLDLGGTAKPVMVHASLRRIGPVEGGAAGLLDALFGSLGADGTVLMIIAANDSLPFDAATTPADPEIGALAEAFRTRRGTLVNDNPAARFAASGPLAGALLEPCPLHDYYGPGSVLSRFAAMNGRVLRLGADTNTVTLGHWAEYLANVPDKRRVSRRYVRADSGEIWIHSLDDSEGIAEWSGSDYFSDIVEEFLALGKARISRVGDCSAECFEAGDFVPFAVNWMERHFATNSHPDDA